jgi:hypothetical protein
VGRGKSGVFNHLYAITFLLLDINIFLVASGGYMSKKRLKVGEAGRG